MIFVIMMLFAMTVTASAANDDTVTRKEWMTDLKATYELDQEDMSMLPEEFFSDPEAPATREFAATTVNYFIGFELNQGLGYSFTDAADVTDKDSAEYAVKKNLLALKDGDVFSPDTPITVAEKDSMLEAAKHIWESQYSMVDTYGEDAIGAARLIVDNDLTGGARHTLYIPKKLNGKTVKYISSGAFQNNTDISFVKIPNTVTGIEANAFNGCTGLGGTLTIPEQVTEMGSRAFGNCTNITKVIIPVDFKYTKGQEPFNGCAGVTEIHYTYGQTGIMRDVYGYISNDSGNYYSSRLEYSTRNSLKTVSFEEGITKIGSGAYFNAYDSSNTYPCTKLKTVMLPASLTEIGANAFKRCTSLEGELTILENVTTIGGSAFSGCNKLNPIYFNGSMPQIGSNAFQGITATAYYPRAHSESWTEEGRQNYGGTLTWYLWPKIKAETPAQPTVTENGITENSVTLTAIVGYEYGILNKDTDEIDWGQENTFNSLSPKTEYTFYQRVAESPEYYASDASEGLTVRTLKTAAEIEEDQAAAAAVTEAIAALPTVVTVNDKAAIEAARTVYDALTDDQKALVSEATLQKLIDAEAALAVAEEATANQAAADAVTDILNDLPGADSVTVGDKEAIEAARAAYDALTGEQKALISAETLKKLTDAETALESAEAAAAEKDKSDSGSPSSIPSSVSPPAAIEEKVIVDLKAVKISKPKAAKKAVTVKWKKVGKKDQKKIQGIEIQISTDSGFQNIVKKTTAGKKKTSKKIKGLKSKTKYWVRIRAYRNDTAGKHVSAWKKKSFKVK